jgi:methyl halide transferase
MSGLNANYWTSRWQEKATGWDIGYPSTPLAEYISQLHDRNIRILIPGCGNAYEAQLLWEKGFNHVALLDIVALPLIQFAEKFPDFPKEQLIHGDFFSHTGRYDLILEQTFYCALDPQLRDEYVKKMYDLLEPGGKLAGVLFNFPLTTEGPPFGGDETEYRVRFEPYFDLIQLHPAENSIAPRAGRELFFEAIRKS